jgi:hypothetical protein
MNPNPRPVSIPNPRPVSILILACLYIAVGAIGFVAHFRDLLAHPQEGIWIEVTELVGLIAGAFMLRRHNWARWLALAWIVFHVILSIFHPLGELIVHATFCAVIAWILFRPPAARYFREGRIETT